MPTMRLMIFDSFLLMIPRAWPSRLLINSAPILDSANLILFLVSFRFCGPNNEQIYYRGKRECFLFFSLKRPGFELI